MKFFINCLICICEPKRHSKIIVVALHFAARDVVKLQAWRRCAAATNQRRVGAAVQLLQCQWNLWKLQVPSAMLQTTDLLKQSALLDWPHATLQICQTIFCYSGYCSYCTGRFSASNCFRKRTFAHFEFLKGTNNPTTHGLIENASGDEGPYSTPCGAKGTER